MAAADSLITSQDVTAPKRRTRARTAPGRLITSQDVTAPKPQTPATTPRRSLITSQDVTAPKPLVQIPRCKRAEILTVLERYSSNNCRLTYVLTSRTNLLVSCSRSKRITFNS